MTVTFQSHLGVRRESDRINYWQSQAKKRFAETGVANRDLEAGFQSHACVRPHETRVSQSQSHSLTPL